MSRDFGPSGNNEVNVDWAFLDYRMSDSIGFRVGKFKKPEGIYNTVRDADAVRTSIMLPQGIYAERLRDIQIAIQGFGAYGFLDLGGAGSMDYVVYLGNQPINKDEPVIRNDLLGSFYGIDEGGSIEFKYSYGFWTFWNTPVSGLRFGLSVNQSLMEINGTNTRYPWYSSEINDAELKAKIRWVASAEYQTERFTLSGEYMKSEFELPASPIGGPITPFGFPAGGLYEFEWESYYLQLNVPVGEKWTFGTYYNWYFETAQGIYSDDDPSDYRHDLAISAKYNVNEWWLLKAEFHIFDGYLGTEPGDSGVRDDSWNMIAIKSSLTF
jgi:hypothetical protein